MQTDSHSPRDNKSVGAATDVAQFRNRHGRLIHPTEGMVFACPSTDHAAPKLRVDEPVKAPDCDCWCSECQVGFDREQLVEREEREVPGENDRMEYLSDAGKAALRIGRQRSGQGISEAGP